MVLWCSVSCFVNRRLGFGFGDEDGSAAGGRVGFANSTCQIPFAYYADTSGSTLSFYENSRPLSIFNLQPEKKNFDEFMPLRIQQETNSVTKYWPFRMSSVEWGHGGSALSEGGPASI